MADFDWQSEIHKWCSPQGNITPALKDSIVVFFRQSFENTPCPDQAWFGIHASGVSLVVGGIYLAAIHRSGSNHELWLLQNLDPPQVDGLSYRPVKSSRNPLQPLIWAYAESLHVIPNLIDSHSLWESFRTASKRILTESRSAASRDAIQKRRGKRRLNEFWPETNASLLTSLDVARIFEQQSFSYDDRSPPDHYRRKNFRSGWGDATTRDKEYRAGTLARLTWQNLGYRFGKTVGSRAVEQIDAVYDELARMYRDTQTGPGEVAIPPHSESAMEGRRILQLHRKSERNRKLIIKKKQLVIFEHGRLACEVCGFDFAQTYGSRGEAFAECHHMHPISQSPTERRTHLSELAIVCANCHRMLHRPPWISVEELRESVQLRHVGRVGTDS